MSLNFIAGRVVVPASIQAPEDSLSVEVNSTSRSEAVKISSDSDNCSLILPKITILWRLSAALAIKLIAFNNDSRLIDNCMCISLIKKYLFKIYFNVLRL